MQTKNRITEDKLKLTKAQKHKKTKTLSHYFQYFCSLQTSELHLLSFKNKLCLIFG